MFKQGAGRKWEGRNALDRSTAPDRTIINQKNHKLTGAWQFFGVKMNFICYIHNI